MQAGWSKFNLMRSQCDVMASNEAEFISRILSEILFLTLLISIAIVSTVSVCAADHHCAVFPFTVLHIDLVIYRMASSGGADVASVPPQCLTQYQFSFQRTVNYSAVATYEATEATASVKICNLRKNLACSAAKNRYFS